MKRSELEKHIGESVEVKLFDGDTMQGVLRKTGTEEVRNNPNLYLKGGYYFLSHKDTYVCKSCLFRVSHIKSLKVLQKEKDTGISRVCRRVQRQGNATRGNAKGTAYITD